MKINKLLIFSLRTSRPRRGGKHIGNRKGVYRGAILSPYFFSRDGSHVVSGST